MPEYRYDPERFPEIERKTFKRLIAMMGTAALVSMLLIVYDGIDLNRDWDLLIIWAILIILLFGFITYRTLKKQDKNLQTFTLAIDDENIVRTQANSTVTIPISSISRISESKKGTLCIIGKNDVDVIPVSAYLKDYEQLKADLYKIKPFETTKADLFWQKFGMVAVFLPAILMMVVFISDNKYVVGIGGAVVVATFGWYIIKIFQMSESNKSLRRLPYMMILVVIAVLLKMLFTLPFLVDLLSHL